jgi:hypothetical protein
VAQLSCSAVSAAVLLSCSYVDRCALSEAYFVRIYSRFREFGLIYFHIIDNSAVSTDSKILFFLTTDRIIIVIIYLP